MAGAGKRGATIRDVARVAGVSVATVSATVNASAYVSPELRARVERAIVETGYAPDGVARSLKRGATQIIGLIISDITNPFFAAVARAAEHAARAAGYAVLMCNTDEDPELERTYLGVLRTQRAAGLIMAFAGPGDAEYVARLRTSAAVPAVLIDRALPALGWDTVVTDNVAAAAAAVAHVAGLGHRRIGFVGGSLRYSTNRERLDGYRRALDAAGLAYDPALVRLENSRRDQARDAALDLLGGADRPGAVFLANVEVCAGVLRALGELGLRCPEDVSVAAIDEFPWAGLMRPRLTVVAQPAEEIGRAAVRLLLDRLKAPGAPPRHLVLPGRLIVRSSCAPPPSGA